MAAHVKHVFVSGKANSTDASLVRPSGWNADHDLQADGPGVLGRSDAGAGPMDIITVAALASLVFPAGVIQAYAGSAAPTGWLLCYGQSLTTAAYPDLFAAIAYQYGGAGANFSLPDLRGRVVAGIDNMGGVAANRLTATTMTPNGVTLGAAGGSQLSTGNLLAGTTTGAQTYSFTTSVESADGTGNVGGGAVFSYAADTHTHTASGSTGGEALSVSGHTDVAIVQPTLALNYIIKAS